MIGEHERQAGYLRAYQELHRRVAADLQAKRGLIKPPRVVFAYYNSAKLLLTRLRLMRRA